MRARPHEAAARESVYRPRHPVSLRLTLRSLGRGPYDPTTVWNDTGFWRTALTPIGAATLHLRTLSDGAIAARAWGDGAEWMLDAVPRLLGSDDDWSSLDVSAHPLLRDALHRSAGLRLARTDRVFESLAPAIIEQKVTSIEAYRSWRRLVAKHGTAAPGPAPSGMRVFPSVEAWRRIPSWEWHRAGVDPRRSQAVLTAALVGHSLERVCALPSDAEGLREAATRLTSVPGVGAWTAAEALQRALGDPDSVSVGDYHLAADVGHALIGSAVDDDGMLELLAPWQGQRQRVIRLIYAGGFTAPRRGPRATIQDHRGH
ncbi:DNA-3-methyladenine glycosylase family protein [Compostimonas suwonensis]|uniref:DNA-3-methyladenine glycosylase family protein n=1 Tax=Compostimonas suwonensis TaxID=1048394 RepID=UPI000C246555|nr:DNA-3-methyladenine glycosylase [Compostimonas suwonensis]